MKNKKSFFNNMILGISIVSIVSMLGVSSNSYADGNPNPNVLPRDSIQFGRSYGDWAAAWWQWALSVPVDNHPLFDNGDCSVEQSGPVFFLGGKFCSVLPGAPFCTAGTATRSCTVSSKKALFFPIVNVEDSIVEEDFFGNPGKTITYLRSFIAGLIDPISVNAQVDGHPIRNLITDFRVQSPVFEFTLPNDNLLKAIGEDIVAGTYSPAVDDGVYMMLSGLRPGNHVIHFNATAGSDVILDITYNLNVVN